MKTAEAALRALQKKTRGPEPDRLSSTIISYESQYIKGGAAAREFARIQKQTNGFE